MPRPQPAFNPIAEAMGQAPSASPWGTPPQFSTGASNAGVGNAGPGNAGVGNAGAGNVGAGNVGAGWIAAPEIPSNVAPNPILKGEAESAYGSSISSKPPATQPSLWNENQSFGVWETAPLESAKTPPPKLPNDLSLANPGSWPLPGSEQGHTPPGLTNQPNAVGNVANNFVNPTTDWGSFATSLSNTPANHPAPPPASPVIQTPEQKPAELPGWGAAMNTAAPNASAPPHQSKTKLPAWSIEAEQVETGTWKAYVPEEALIPAAPPPMIKPAGPDFSSYPLADSLFNSRIEDENEWEMPIQEKLARQRANAALPEAKPTLPLDTFQPPPAPSQPFPFAPGQPAAFGQAGANSAPPPATPPPNNSPWSNEIAPPVNLPPALTTGQAYQPGEAYAKPVEVFSARAANIPDAALWGLDADEVASTMSDAGKSLQSNPIAQSSPIEELKTPPSSGAWGQPPKPSEPAIGTPSPFNAGTWPAVEAVPQVPASPALPTPVPPTPAPPTPAPIANAASSLHAPPPATETVAFPQAAAQGQPPKITPVPVKANPIAPPQRTAEIPKDVPSKAAPQGQNTYPPFAAPLASSPLVSAHSSGSLSNDKPPTALPAKDAATAGSGGSPAPASAPAGGSISPHAGLFNLDDKAVDKIFESLGVTERSLPASPVQQNAAPNMAPPPPVPYEPTNFSPPQPFPLGPSQYGSPPKAEPDTATVVDQGRLFSIDDKIIDRIFADNLGIKDGASASLPKVSKVTVTEAVKQISDAALAAPVPPPKIEGLGRLDSRPESHDSGSGRISSIGKFLLDGKDLEKIGKITSSDLTHTTMRILPMEAAMELHSLLQSVGSQPKVLGSVIIGKDGLLIANTMPAEIDGEQLGVWALAVYMNTQNAARKLGNERVYQIVSKTPRGYLIIADFGSGLLVTVSDARETDALVPLMRTITQLVAS
jgi:predicted regulator of Ras-like GTPase activity (Roadblock/LC7/MglB family)